MILGRLRERVVRNWLRPGGDIRLEVCRIVLGVALLAMLSRLDPVFRHGDFTAYLASNNPETFQPAGLMWLLGGYLPPAEVWSTVWRVTYVALIFSTIGLFTRVSLVTGVVGLWALLSLRWSWTSSWSHQQCHTMLAGIAFMFAPAGRRLSVDALIAAVRTRWFEPGPLRSNPWAVWAPRLAQLSTALMFAAAAYQKLSDSGYHWVFSDSLRNHIVVTWHIYGPGVPDHLRWVVDNEAAWQGLALANLVTQLAPLVACLLVRRPLLMAIVGLSYVFEVLGLAVVMGFWHPYWLLLYVFFVDWDRFVGWIALKTAPLRERLRITLYYDGVCGRRVRVMNLIRQLDWLGVVTFVDATTVESLPSGVDRATALERATGYDGRRLCDGADAYRAIFWRLPLTWPLALALTLPGARHLARTVYDAAASRRKKQDAPEVSHKAVARTSAPIARVLVPLWCCLFLGFYVFTIVTRTETKHRVYPFSQYQMYSKIRAFAPYDQHYPFFYVRGQFEISAKNPRTEQKFARLRYSITYNRHIKYDDLDVLAEGLRAFWRVLGRRYRVRKVRELRLYREILEIPAYPAPAVPREHFRALEGMLRGEAFFGAATRVFTGENGNLLVQLDSVGLEQPRLQLVESLASKIGRPRLFDPPGRWLRPGLFELGNLEHGQYAIVVFARAGDDADVRKFFGSYLNTRKDYPRLPH